MAYDCLRLDDGYDHAPSAYGEARAVLRAPMPTHLLLEELTREEARAVAADTLLVFPTGATGAARPAPAGRHRYFAVEHIARGAAAAVAGEIPVLVAPTLPFGSRTHHLPVRRHDVAQHRDLLSRPVRPARVADHRRLPAASSSSTATAATTSWSNSSRATWRCKHDAHLAAASYWNAAWDALTGRRRRTAHGRLPGHAGAFETSLVLALRPELVARAAPGPRRRARRRPAPQCAAYRAEFHGCWQSFDGYTDSPARATGRAGTGLSGRRRAGRRAGARRVLRGDEEAD